MITKMTIARKKKKEDFLRVFSAGDMHCFLQSEQILTSQIPAGFSVHADLVKRPEHQDALSEKHVPGNRSDGGIC